MCDKSSSPAHVLWVELSTRVATRPLHFRSGEEETAAKSIAKIFLITRDLMDKNPDAKIFQPVALALLNDTLAPYTSRWHGWMTEDDELLDENGKPRLRFRDEWVRRQFRRELRALHPRLFGFMKAFEVMKNGGAPDPSLTSPDEARLIELREECPQPQAAKLGKEVIPGIREQVLFAGCEREDQDPLTDSINQIEQFEIRKRRGLAGDIKPTNLTALAFSGGGIRSATFCLGITQVLARRRLFKNFDYMSTVSGGGYFGSFLSTYLGTGVRTPPPPTDEVQTRLDDVFETGDDQREPRPVRHLRNWSRYLLDGSFGRKVAGIGMVFAGVLFNLLILLPVPLAAALLTKGLYHLKWLGDFNWTDSDAPLFPPWYAPWSVSLEVLLGAAMLVVMIYPKIKTASLESIRKVGDSKLLNIWQYSFLFLAGFTTFLLICWILPPSFRLYHLIRHCSLAQYFHLMADRLEVASALLGTILTAVMGALASKAKPGGMLQKKLGKSVIFAGPILYLLCYFGVSYHMMFTPGAIWPWQWVLGLAVLLLIWSLLIVDVNTYSPHGYYRDRLSECYLQQPQMESPIAGGPKEWVLKHADGLRLSQLNGSSAAPYHLINATLNVPSSKNRELRGRNGDFFLFSKHFCGSPLVGYHPTLDLEVADPHFDLGTAMAISGAAVSSNMGWQTNNSLRLMMTIANIRLGYWLRNPNFGPEKTKKMKGPGPLCLVSEMFACWMNEKEKHLNLSDGGHIENLAVYELLRRRCKFIVCVDGGMEPGMQCADLTRLERYAAIDLGIKMHYDLSDLKLQSNGFVRAYGVLVKIDYSPPLDESFRQARKPEDAEWGWMLYLKLAMVGYGPGYVMDYKRQNPTFPHQTTAEQIYNEGQFEAYRALGEAAAESFFTSDILNGKAPLTVEAWFESLASALLPDNDEAFR